MNKRDITAVQLAFPIEEEQKWSQCNEAHHRDIRSSEPKDAEVTLPAQSSGFQLIHREPSLREMLL